MGCRTTAKGPEFERAAALTRNERERAFLAGRAAACQPLT
jgi:predicted RNA polymerase sigma factor